MYLQELFGFEHPTYAHIPMLMAPEGRRLSKRDQDLDMGALRSRLTPEQLIGVLAHAAGLTETAQPISAKELATVFDWNKIHGKEIVVTELEKLYR
jgi:glutamyl-tRNA synthetase